jgi:hypothetical protein
MASTVTRQEARGQPVAEVPIGSDWTVLFRTAGLAALTSALLIPVQVAVFLAWPAPFDGTAADWFTFLAKHPLAGLVNLDLLLVVDNVLLIPLLLAFYVVLRRVNASVMALAVAFAFSSVFTYLVTNPAVALARLSDQYAAATTDAQRTTALAAGDATLAAWQGSGFHAGYLLGSVAGVLIGLVMLRSGVFGKPTAYLAIVANAVGLGLYLPRIGLYVSVFSVVFLEIWYILVGRRLLRIGWRREHRRARR